MMPHGRWRLVAGSVISMAALLAAAPALAQSGGEAVATAAADDAPRGATQEVVEVVVTGSRAITNGAAAPTPLTVVSAAQLQAAQPGNMADAVNQLPVFRGSQRPTTAGSAGTTLGAGANLLTLRALSPFRTLVVLDGRRIVPTQLTGATDANLIPQSLVKRVDVVTGGASAAYGSDAVAGVVNFVLDTNYEGLKGQLQGGISSRNDAGTEKANLTFGRSFADDKLHVIVSGDYFKQRGIDLNYNGRDFAEGGYGLIGASSASSALVVAPDVRDALSSTGGLILSCAPTSAACPIARMQFLPGGALAPYRQGQFVTTSTMSGGDGSARRTNLIAGYRTSNLFGRVAYDLNADTTLYAEGLYGELHSHYFGSQSGVSGTSAATIFADNAFLPAALRTTMANNGISSFGFARATFDFGSSFYTNDTKTRRVVAGIDGSLGGSWKYSAYAEYGKSTFRLATSNNVNVERFYNALDAVVNPANGQIVCRTTLLGTAPGAGCVPLNLFGENAASPEALAYVKTKTFLLIHADQVVLSGDVRGEPFSLPAGPVSFAAGLEYRRETGDQSSGPDNAITRMGTGIRGYPAAQVNQSGAYQLSPAQALEGSFNVKEGFVEVSAPLVKDMPGFKSLDLNGAARYADYSSVGGVMTWKAGLNWQPVEGLRFRATRSRDIRAPSINERFSPVSPVIGQAANDPQRNGARFLVVQLNRGNPDLKQETANTTAIGVVVAPTFLPGFTASLDHFDIKIDDVIAGPTIQSVVDACGQSACADVIRNADGTINSVFTRQQNLAQLHTKGEDFEVGYVRPLDMFGQSGTLSARLLVTHTQDLTVTIGAVKINRVGDLNITPSSNPPGVAEWTGNFSLDYRGERLRLFAQERYVGKGFLDKTLVYAPGQSNRVPETWYTDVTVGYRFPQWNNAVEGYVTINNLFDQDPRITPNGALTTPRPVNAGLYDPVGRFYTAGLRFAF